MLGQIETSYLNVERGCILLNLAIMYWLRGEELLRVSLRDVRHIQANKTEEVVSSMCKFGRKALSAIIYCRTNIVPYIQSFGITWDLTTYGIAAVGSLVW